VGLPGRNKMIFNIASAEKVTNKLQEWNKWFAWYPIQFTKDKLIWLKYIERRLWISKYGALHFGGGYEKWYYRKRGSNKEIGTEGQEYSDTMLFIVIGVPLVTGLLIFIGILEMFK